MVAHASDHSMQASCAAAATRTSRSTRPRASRSVSVPAPSDGVSTKLTRALHVVRAARHADAVQQAAVERVDADLPPSPLAT